MNYYELLITLCAVFKITFGLKEVGNEKDDGEMKIQDETHMSTMALRQAIYLTIMSSISAEECAHKILQMNIKPKQEVGGATAYTQEISITT